MKPTFFIIHWVSILIIIKVKSVGFLQTLFKCLYILTLIFSLLYILYYFLTPLCTNHFIKLLIELFVHFYVTS